MEFIAFKALFQEGDTLYSPLRRTPWMYDLQGRPCLSLDGLDGMGIFAATWEEAAKYGGDIYMVVPFLFDGGDPLIALGTHGWRSSQATVVGGPWAYNDKERMRQAAQFVMESYRQGYRQVEAVLFWATIILDSYDDLTIPLLIPILEWGVGEEEWDTRMDALLAAIKIGAPALSVLERAMQDDSQAIRVEAVRAAGKIGAPALSILELAMRDHDPHVREEAVCAAGNIGAIACSILERAMEDENSNVRVQAVHTARKIGLPALPILERAIQDELHLIRKYAVYAAGKIGSPALHVVERGMEDEDWAVRKEAVHAAGQIGEAALHILERAMQDDNPAVREAAFKVKVGTIAQNPNGGQPA
jgi:hypothetical protein